MYGTLKSGFGNRYARRLRREARLLGQAQMAGRLYRIHWHPGMRPPRGSGDTVSGELYKLRQPSKTLEVLDAYEGQTYYRRELHRATLDTGQTFRAWVYMYRRRRPEQCYVVSGEWLPDQAEN